MKSKKEAIKQLESMKPIIAKHFDEGNYKILLNTIKYY